MPPSSASSVPGNTQARCSGANRVGCRCGQGLRSPPLRTLARRQPPQTSSCCEATRQRTANADDPGTSAERTASGGQQPEAWQRSRRTGTNRHRDQPRPDHGGRVISGPLTSVTRGISRSLTDSRSGRSGRSTARTVQIPKLIVRVRFPSPARAHQQFSIRYSHDSCRLPTGRQDCPLAVLSLLRCDLRTDLC